MGPKEIRDQILTLCDQDDLQNLACCCRQFSDLVKAVLWQRVYVCTGELREFPKDILTNLQHVRTLTLSRTFDDEETEDAFAYGYHFCTILSACDPATVKKLISKGFYVEGMNQALAI